MITRTMVNHSECFFEEQKSGFNSHYLVKKEEPAVRFKVWKVRLNPLIIKGTFRLVLFVIPRS
jgi:hypothetical protein